MPTIKEASTLVCPSCGLEDGQEEIRITRSVTYTDDKGEDLDCAGLPQDDVEILGALKCSGCYYVHSLST